MTADPCGFELEGWGADVAVRVWGPDAAACLAQAVVGFAAAFVDADPDAAHRSVGVDLRAADPAELLVALLDEAITLLDGAGEVALGLDGATVERGSDGHLRLGGRLRVAPLSAVEQTGAAPKSVTWHALSLAPADGGWRGQVVLDL